jgi:hypothetical protein
MTAKTNERKITMAITGYVFQLTQEKIENRIHNFTLLGFHDTQQEAFDAFNQHIDLMGFDGVEKKSDKTDVVYQFEGTTSLDPGAKFIVSVKVVSAAHALNSILAMAKKRLKG